MSETMIRPTTTGYTLPVFPSRRAPELDGERARHPVAIIGAGLAGLTAACDLAMRGIRVVVLDEDDTVGVRGASSRALTYAQRNLEMFERFGIYDRIAAKGNTWSVGHVMRNDEELYAFDLASETLSRQPPFTNIQQFYVEWFLVDRLALLPLADLRWKSRVTAIRAGDDEVALDVASPEGSYTLAADWVIDASGLGSLVRKSLGVDAHTSPSGDRWCICDVRFARPASAERYSWVEAEFNGGRGVWQHQMGDNVWRIDHQMPTDADLEEISRPEVVRARLGEQFGPDTEVELVWVGAWGYRTHLLDVFRHGRVFFIGDAAHAFSPFGARGGNSGIQDAENISWKLAAVIQGLADAALLETYNLERRAAAVFNVTTTERSARFVAPRSPFEHSLRNAVLDLGRRHAFARGFVNMGRMSVPYSYDASPLSTSAGDAFPNITLGLPDGSESSIARLLDGGGTRLLILAGPGAPELPELPCYVTAYAAGAAAGGLPVLTGDQLAALVRPGEVLVLRPDQHVSARLQRPSAAQVEAALRRTLGFDIRQHEATPA